MGRGVGKARAGSALDTQVEVRGEPYSPPEVGSRPRRIPPMGTCQGRECLSYLSHLWVLLEWDFGAFPLLP